MRAAVLSLVILVAGCTAEAGNSPPTPAPSATASGTFVPYTSGAAAVGYDPALVPTGATATVTITPTAPGTEIRLAVTGLRPRRSYGAHLHTNPCGPTGAVAGPHYQHQPDPAASPPSVNPSYANPHNEVWLDFTTDAGGDATSAATVQWRFDTGRRPRSLVIHAATTKTATGQAGDAGARVACLTLPG
ncbi:superoxide dismutase family protein [Micromonospora sp. DT47]|uniref:superoxide dismutase family protein n=1 Tax=Micromonospora sp. DT47 TaxID=3393431 RepID=UPI003CF4E72E